MRYFIFILFLFFSSCATKPLKLETGLTPSEFWEDQSIRKRFFQQVDGKAKVRIEEKGKSVSGNSRLLMHSIDSIKMELRDMFGRLHFSALKKEASFVAFFPPQKLAFLDEEGGRQYLKQKLNVALRFDQVLDLWLGRLPSSLGNSFKSWKWEGKEGNYVGVLESKNSYLECYIDGDLGILKKIVWKKPAPAFQVVYEDMGACCGDKGTPEKLDLAYSVKLEVLDQTEKLEVEWDELFTGAKLPRAFDIELPKDTEKILLNP